MEVVALLGLPSSFFRLRGKEQILIGTPCTEAVQSVSEIQKVKRRRRTV